MVVRRRPVAAVCIISAALTLDQVSKLLARAALSGTESIQLLNGLVELRYIENHGGFLGYLNALPESIRIQLLTSGVFLLLVAALVALWHSSRLTFGQTIALSLIIAGGAGNLLDRLVNHGGVIDFLLLGTGALQTGVFNLADVFILAGSFSFGASLATR